MASQRIEDLRNALRSGSSLTPDQALLALEMIDAFERALRELASRPDVSGISDIDDLMRVLGTRPR